MPCFPIENLRCDIIWCATDCVFFLSIEFQFRSKTEVPEFDFHFLIEEQVSQLEISVNYMMTMQVFQSDDNLLHVTLNFKFCESFPSLEELIQRVVSA